MRAMKLVQVGIFLLGITTALFAQKEPIDLSGTWQLNIAKSHPAKFGKHEIKLKPATLVIQCTATTIQMSYTSGGKVFTQTYTPDGKGKIINQGHGGETAVKAYWKKSVLIIETSGRGYILGGLSAQSHATELYSSTQRWSLSADGNTLIHEEDDPKSLSVFDRVPTDTSTAPSN